MPSKVQKPGSSTDHNEGLKFPLPAGGDGIQVAVVYPGSPDEGLASLAVHGLVRLFNDHPLARAEPVFAPPVGRPAVGALTGRPLSSYELVAFSISFEQQWAALADVLKSAGIPRRWNRRADLHPLILAGGVACRLNPRPGLPFVDLLAPGDAEAILGPVVQAVYHGRGLSRAQVLEELDGIGGLVAQPFTGKRVRPVFWDEGPPVCQLGRGKGSSFAGVFLVETGRGCPAGCRFCALGFSRRPPVFYSPEAVVEQAQAGLDKGERIGLVGASLGRHPQLAELVSEFSDSGADVSPASLDPEVLLSPAGPTMLQALRDGGQRTVTLAPEAGSERLRRVINKPFSDEVLEEAVARLGEAGVINLKLYLMYGLPFEERSDLEQLLALVGRIRVRLLAAHKARGGTGRINVSLNPFVPKPQTPFARVAMPPVRELKRRRDFVRTGLRKLGGINVSGFSPRQAVWQCLLDRADESIAPLLMAASNSWPPPSDLVRQLWPEGLDRVHQPWPLDQVPPWDFVHSGVKPEFLARELDRAGREKTTRPCAPARCTGCAACSGMGHT